MTTLSPSTQLSKDPVESILGWFQTKNMPPVLIHLYSVVVHSIYRIFCKIRDKRNIQKDELLWMTVLSFHTTTSTTTISTTTTTVPVTTTTTVPTGKTCTKGYYNKKLKNGPDGSCCADTKDCIGSCIFVPGDSYMCKNSGVTTTTTAITTVVPTSSSTPKPTPT